jgi:hypothetical protein
MVIHVPKSMLTHNERLGLSINSVNEVDFQSQQSPRFLFELGNVLSA